MRESVSLNNVQLLSPAQAAALLSISVRSLWRLLAAGELPQPVRIGGGRLVRWKLSDLERMIEGAQR